jgi:hypothetical protein
VGGSRRAGGPSRSGGQVRDDPNMDDLARIVRRYGVTGRPDWADDCVGELSRANRLWKRLVDIDREAAAAYAVILLRRLETLAWRQRFQQT